MFTGLIEEVGLVLAAEQNAAGSRFTIGASHILDATTQLGDSIAVDGACMTVVALDTNSFSFEASPESLARTTIGTWQPGRRVNLERPLTPTSRIGGHYVTGHIDGLARLINKEVQGNSTVLSFEVDTDELAELLVSKGSVAILGISLTVNTVANRRFQVAIIPHTLAHTSLGDYQIGDSVNIETDLLGKYVRRLLPGNRNTETTEQADSREPLIDIPALRPATDAIRSTSAFGPAQIRTGGWFNFDDEEGAPHD
jgi:riboflavin synthase